MLKAFARKNKMRFDKVQDIWANRATWASMESKEHGNLKHGDRSGKNAFRPLCYAYQYPPATF